MAIAEIIEQIANLPNMMPFPPQKQITFARGANRLQTCLNPLATDADFAGMGFAVVDLTLGAGSMTYAGIRDRQQLYGASLVKIVAMYAAFALREAVRNAAKVVHHGSRKELFQKLDAFWRPVVEKGDPKRAKDFPQFGQIFGLSNPIDFNTDFKGHLEKMITISKNESAQACIQRLGYQYVNGALVHAGLFDSVGLWLGADYNYGRVYGEIKVDPSVTKKVHDPKLLTTQGATAESVAEFMTLVEAGELVSADASREMKLLMARQVLESDFKKTLQDNYTGVNAYGKIGIGYGVGDDCAIIERKAVVRTMPRLEKRIKYAAVGLREPKPYNLKKLILKLDECVVKFHTP